LPVWRHRRGDRAAARKGEGFYWYSLGLEGYFRDFENEVDRIFVGASLAVGCMKGAFRCRPKLKDKSLSKGALSRVSEVDPGFFFGFDGIKSISWILFGVAALVSLPKAFLVPAASLDVVGHSGSSLASSDVASEFLFPPMLSSTGACRSTGVVRLWPSTSR